ncbi:MAG TPA: hypothetical protein VFV46_03445 [Lacibacter sp.]|nr:hypothetical protein [Lacibacter sp.]
MKSKQVRSGSRAVKKTPLKKATVKSPHEPQQFWQAVAMVAMFELKHRQQIIETEFYRK